MGNILKNFPECKTFFKFFPKLAIIELMLERFLLRERLLSGKMA